jgi:hypothetical protein
LSEETIQGESAQEQGTSISGADMLVLDAANELLSLGQLPEKPPRKTVSGKAVILPSQSGSDKESTESESESFSNVPIDKKHLRSGKCHIKPQSTTTIEKAPINQPTQTETVTQPVAKSKDVSFLPTTNDEP